MQARSGIEGFDLYTLYIDLIFCSIIKWHRAAGDGRQIEFA